MEIYKKKTVQRIIVMGKERFLHYGLYMLNIGLSGKFIIWWWAGTPSVIDLVKNGFPECMTERFICSRMNIVS